MSASVYCHPRKTGKCVGKSALRKILEDAFGQMPIQLSASNKSDLDLLVRVTEGEELRKELEKICDAIETHDEIEVYVEY